MSLKPGLLYHTSNDYSGNEKDMAQKCITQVPLLKLIPGP